MTPKFGHTDLDCEVVFDRDLAADDTLTVFQETLAGLAPRWASGLRIWRGPQDQRPIDAGRPGALRASLVTAAGEHGPTYRSLVDRHGVPPFERLAGSAELRGSGTELVAVVPVDSMVVSPLGTARQLGNRLALQIRRPKVGRSSGVAWRRKAFEVLCNRLSPAWGWGARG